MQRMLSNFWRSIATFLLLLNVSASAFAEPDYVKVYHPVIHQAEASILNKDYEAALAHYQQAFAAVPTPFVRDYYNATVCAALAQDTKQTFEYLEQLALRGVSLSYLEQQQVFDSLQTTKKWRKFKKKYPKYRRNFEQSANLDLRADLDELYARDQYFRQAKGGLRVHADTLRKIEAANVQNLLNWVKEYGFPGEALIGVADTLEDVPRFSIVIQRQNIARKGYDFTEILTRAVHEGRLSPHAAAFLMDVQAGRSRYQSKALVKVKCSCAGAKKFDGVDKYLAQTLNEKEQKQVDALREQLGLEPLADYRAKVLYSMHDKRFKLNHSWSVANYIVPSMEAAEVLMEGLTVVE